MPSLSQLQLYLSSSFHLLVAVLVEATCERQLMGNMRLCCAASSEEPSDRGDADADPREKGEIFTPKLTKPDAVLTAPQKGQ
jgi:hypothetical protein